MPTMSTKHPKRETILSVDSFDAGYTEEVDPNAMGPNQLYDIENFQYVHSTGPDGKKRVILRQRHGTTKINASAIGGLPDVDGVTYYFAASRYMMAAGAALYYVNDSDVPTQIGTNILGTGPNNFTEFNEKLIIHTTGITKFWDGDESTPEPDVNYGSIDKSFADEVLATGDDSTTEFSGILDNFAVTGSTLEISFTNSTSKTISDDGIGRLTGNVPAASAGSGIVETVTGAVTNGGLIQLTVTGTGFADGDQVNVQDVGGVPNATNTYALPRWIVTNKTANTIDLVASTFGGVYTSGGTVSINTIIYAAGIYNFNTDGAPDDQTTITAEYDKLDGAPKSHDGLVRGSRLYTWGDADNPSRLTYTEVGDEKATDTSTGGGYLDVDPDDGTALMGVVNFETSLLLAKENSLYRIDGYPDDADFRVEKLSDDLGCVNSRSMMFEGGIVSFLSKNGWMAMHPSQRYGDVQKGVPLSKEFGQLYSKWDHTNSFVGYNHFENQLWLMNSASSKIYVICLDTGGQLTKFSLGGGQSGYPKSFASVNGEFLIGSSNGDLFKYDKTTIYFQDNGVEMNYVLFQTGFNDWGMDSFSKHCKRVQVKVNQGKTFDVELMTTITDPTSALLTYTETTSATADLKTKFEFDRVSIKVSEVEDAAAKFGAEIWGIDFKVVPLGKV